MVASRVRLGAIFDTTAENAVWEYARRESAPIKPVMVENGPVKDVKMIGDEVDLTKLPVCFHSEKDAGLYLTPTLFFVKDPDSGVINCGMYRMMLRNRNEFGISFGPQSHAAHIVRKYEARGMDMPFVCALGHHPALVLGSQARMSIDESELDVMGGLLGEPVQLVPCETVDLPVPAWSEIAIEGVLKAGVREPEAPFGEFTWYYGPQRDNPVLQVTAVTHRQDAIFHGSVQPLHRAQLLRGAEPREHRLQARAAGHSGPARRGVPESGTSRFIAFLQMKKEFDGYGRNACLAALAADPFIKIAVAVDEDINPYNEREVLWAIVTRSQPDRDWFFVPYASVCPVDSLRVHLQQPRGWGDPRGRQHGHEGRHRRHDAEGSPVLRALGRAALGLGEDPPRRLPVVARPRRRPPFGTAGLAAAPKGARPCPPAGGTARRGREEAAPLAPPPRPA